MKERESGERYSLENVLVKLQIIFIEKFSELSLIGIILR